MPPVLDFNIQNAEYIKANIELLGWVIRLQIFFSF